MQNKVNKVISILAAHYSVDIPFPKVYFRRGMTKTAAFTSFRRNSIVLSKYFFDLNPVLFQETVLHEISHVVAEAVFGCADHGEKWQLVCVQLGIPVCLCYEF
jgi:predicted SprT family Zn-dependent metalloprotease